MEPSTLAAATVVATGMGVGTFVTGVVTSIVSSMGNNTTSAQGADRQTNPASSPKEPRGGAGQAKQNSGDKGRERQAEGAREVDRPWIPVHGREEPRDRRRRVAKETLKAIEKGWYEFRGERYHLDESLKSSVDGTVFYEEEGRLSKWMDRPQVATQSKSEASISILNITTLDAARILNNSYRFTAVDSEHPPKTGVLNFASATQPGGGFENGAEAQEESIARVSTLIHSLESEEGERFYKTHEETPSNHYYTHGCIFSPDVIVFRNDQGDTVEPFEIQVVSSAAVNAGRILADDMPKWKRSGEEQHIEELMFERMGRILYAFEKHGVRNIVLGTFGTGVFKNDVPMVAKLWARLLVVNGSRFRYSFDRVIFAVTGDSTFAEFKVLMDNMVKRNEDRRPARGGRRQER